MSIINLVLEKYGVKSLNSATKYPSIMTYHELGGKGMLLESLVDGMDFSAYETCFITEKIDGTNARIIFTGERDKCDYIIGSREELLYAKGDRFGNPQMNIVDTIKYMAENLCFSSDNTIKILYGEVYGGNVTASSKQYTNDKTFGFRIFDIAEIPIDILDNSLQYISTWREQGGQQFADVDTIQQFAQTFDLETVPYITTMKGTDIPTDRVSVLQFLQQFADTKAGLNHSGHAEGIVVRDTSRTLIRKIRFEDYQRTAKREKWTF